MYDSFINFLSQLIMTINCLSIGSKQLESYKIIAFDAIKLGSIINYLVDGFFISGSKSFKATGLQ
ncbi:Uncharacterised protein [Legionella pneumophila]|nr:Uncharacterised protein [Legionella pneumophila]CZH45031.1 Uncharacterised protein [Legionella pneumophila]